MLSAVVANVELVAPFTAAPLMNHWYCGALPPFVGVAVNVTLVPAQIVVSDAATLTDAGKFGLTVIVMPVDVAGEPVKQGLALDVITTVTTSLLASVEVVYVDAVAPETAAPLMNH